MDETLQKIIEDLYKKILDKDNEINRLKQSVEWKNKELESHDTSFRKLNNEIDNYRKQIKDLEEQVKKEQDKRSQLTSYIISQDKNINTSSILSTNTWTIWSSRN